MGDADPQDLRYQPPGLPASRRDAMHHLLHPDQVRDSATVARQPSLRNATLAGLQAAITAAVALPLFYLSPWYDLIGFASLGALVALFGRFAPARGRNRVVFLAGVLQVLTVLTMSTVAWLGAPIMAQLVLLALCCGLFLFLCISGRFGAPGPLIFVFAAGASMAPGLAASQVLERSGATLMVAALAWAICAASEAFRRLPGPDPAEQLPPWSARLAMAVRTSIGARIAIFASYAFGANHPAWAAMGAVAVLQGTHLHISMNRGVQRMAGTVVGAMLAWILLMQDPSIWTVIAVLVTLQLLTEIVIGFNYAFGQVLVTPMAILMTYIAAPHVAGPEMAPERVLDTMLGASIGIVIAVLLSSIEDRRHLAELRSGDKD